MEPAELVVVGARVIDPETGLDGIRNVAVRGGTITAVTGDVVPGARQIDGRGQVLCPGFIDLHSHVHTQASLRLQSLDGVTTTLDLEAGALGQQEFAARVAREGRPINVGCSAGWIVARMHVVDGVAVEQTDANGWTNHVASPGWQRPVDAATRARIRGLLAQELRAGAVGIGALLGLAPHTDEIEYTELASLAAEFDVPLVTHQRHLSARTPDSSLDSVREVLRAAAAAGAHVHLCHLNSTSNVLVEPIIDEIRAARAGGVAITTEAYPYGSGATVMGAGFIHPANLADLGLDHSVVFDTVRRRRPRSGEEFLRWREETPGALAIWDWADENTPAGRELLRLSLRFEDTAIASDATWLSAPDGSMAPDSWPVAANAVTHPRSAGCFAKTLRWVVREQAMLTLPEAIRRATLVPAQILASAAPGMRRKGRVQVGCDADLVLFDADTVSDHADYADTTAASSGFSCVLVGGVAVVEDGRPVMDVRPGRRIEGRWLDGV